MAEKPKGPNKKALIIIGVVGALIVLAAIGSGHSNTAAIQAGAVAQTAAAPPNGGVAVADAKLDLGISSVRLADQVGGPYFTQRASDGGVLVVVAYAVKNTSDKPVSAAEMPTLHLVDGNGTQYSVDAGKTSAQNLASHADVKEWSDLNPGITVHNAAVFEVARSDFDPKTWSIVTNDGDASIPVASAMSADKPHKSGHHHADQAEPQALNLPPT